MNQTKYTSGNWSINERKREEEEERRKEGKKERNNKCKL
jgi:hypothetical protein